jgi:hypothetical protein
VREVGALARRAGATGKRLPTLTIDTRIGFRSAADRAAFADDLTARCSTWPLATTTTTGAPTGSSSRPTHCPRSTREHEPERPAPPRVQRRGPRHPEQVWQAIATAKGMSAWFLPTEMEEREGGSLHFTMGPEMGSDGHVTAGSRPTAWSTRRTGPPSWARTRRP